MRLIDYLKFQFKLIYAKWPKLILPVLITSIAVVVCVDIGFDRPKDRTEKKLKVHISDESNSINSKGLIKFLENSGEVEIVNDKNSLNLNINKDFESRLKNEKKMALEIKRNKGNQLEEIGILNLLENYSDSFQILNSGNENFIKEIEAERIKFSEISEGEGQQTMEDILKERKRNVIYVILVYAISFGASNLANKRKSEAEKPIYKRIAASGISIGKRNIYEIIFATLFLMTVAFPYYIFIMMYRQFRIHEIIYGMPPIIILCILGASLYNLIIHICSDKYIQSVYQVISLASVLLLYCDEDVNVFGTAIKHGMNGNFLSVEIVSFIVISVILYILSNFVVQGKWRAGYEVS